MLFDVAYGRGGGAVQARVNRKPFRKFRCKNGTFKNVKSTECGTRYGRDRSMPKKVAAIFRFSMSAANSKKQAAKQMRAFCDIFFVMKNPEKKISCKLFKKAL
jgi:hypothetical protein